MKTLPRKPSIVCLLALTCGWFAGSAAGQVPGLYKDGVLIERMDDLIPPSNEPQRMNTARLAHPAREISSGTAERNLASNECAAAVEKLREEVMRLHASGREPNASEREVLANLRAGVEVAAGKLVEALAPLAARLRLNRASLPAEALDRHLNSMELMQRNKGEYLAAIDALAQGNPGALAAAADVVEKYRPKPQKPLPSQPTILSYHVEAPRMTRAEADSLLASNTSSGSPSSPLEAPVNEEPAALRQSSGGTLDPVPQGGPGQAPPNPSNLIETVEIQFTPEITAKAAELGNSALAIYEFVRNKVEFQPYLGSRKGAAETLRQLHGNDTDQASLLMALLRVSGIPCRYVRGSVELSTAQATSWLGVDDPGMAGGILTTAGLDGVSIINGSEVDAVRCTRVWVEAYIPYTNYRGIPNATIGKTWVPLDPSFHGTVVTPGEDVLTAMGFDCDDYLEDYISTFHPESPVELLLSDIQTWLDTNDPGKTVADIERTTEMDPLELGLLPASIPGELLVVSSRFSELESNKRYKVRFHLHNDGTTFINHTLNLSDLAGRQLTIDYIGATPADQAIIDANGGIYETPPNLVDVKPRLKLDGIPLVTSPFAIGMGRTHDSDMQFIQPVGANNAKPLVENTMTAGNGKAIAFNTFFDQSDGFLFGGNAPALSFLEMQLHGTAADYLGRVNRGIQQTGRLMGVATIQDVSEAIVESAVSVTTSFGVPVTFEWTGLIVDADRRIIGPFAVDGDDSKDLPFMFLAGYEGSIQENRVFEDIYEQEAVSTIKILELSSDSSIPIYRITNSIASDAPGLNQSSSIVSAINDALARGHHVVIPRDPITVGLWQGSGYIDLNPLTGAAGYIISGGINGGVTSNGGATVESWPVFLPCNNPQVRGHPSDAEKIKSFRPAKPTPSENFCSSYTKGIQFKGKYQIKCPDHDWQDMSFDQTTSKTVKQIADQYGTGEYTLQLFADVLLKLAIIQVELHPLAADFSAGKTGRVIISTKHDDIYHTSTKTTKADKIAQTMDRKVTITAHLLPADVATGKTIYFRVLDPDADDASPYEAGTARGDNRAPTDKAGKLSADSDTSVKVTINGTEVAASEVDMTFTDRYSGDNYLVECSIESDFDPICSKTVEMVAWKRIYLEKDKMYLKGATVTTAFSADGDASNDTLTVDNTTDFAVGDSITIFNSAGTTRARTVVSKTATTLTVGDIDVGFAQYSGVKLVASNDTFNAGTDLFDKAYGANSDGSDGGCFIEFTAAPSGSSNIPKYTSFPDDNIAFAFCDHWFNNSGSNANLFQLVSADKHDDGSFGTARSADNMCFITTGNFTAGPTKAAAVSETTVHEIAHQFSVANGHVDQHVSVHNHEGTDDCVMSYTRDRDDGIVEFDTDCIYDIRDAPEPQ